jgi:hypothetical protein
VTVSWAMPKKGAKKKGAKKGPSKAEKAAAALEAEAKAMFKAIDTDGDGSLSPWEVVRLSQSIDGCWLESCDMPA